MKNKIIIIIFTAVCVYLLFVIIRSQKSVDSQNTMLLHKAENLKTQKYNIYKSRQLKITLRVPAEYQVEEGYTHFLLKSPQGEINVGKISTSFHDADSYLEKLGELNKVSFDNKKNSEINGYRAVFVEIKSQETGRYLATSYFIYADKWLMYSLSTKSSNLYADLDDIAKSFQYTP